LSTVRVSDETKRMLVLVSSKLQEMLGRRVSFDETIRFMVQVFLEREENVAGLFGVLKGVEASELHEILRLERRVERLERVVEKLVGGGRVAE